MKKEFHLVVGNARSGTSSLMLALRSCGVPISGYKNPIKMYDKAKNIIDAGVEDLTNIDMAIEVKRRNVTGFWEYGSVSDNGLQRQHEEYDGKVIKVMENKLGVSNPMMVDKVLYITRDPRCVLQSRITLEDLKAEETGILDLNAMTMVFNGINIFVWLKNKLKPFKIVIYEELIADPVKVMTDICSFLERGDGKWATEAIDARLNRSKKISHESTYIDKCVSFYETLKSRDVLKILAMQKELGAIGRDIDEIYARVNEGSNKVTV